ncbi:MAG: carboxylesterase family protein [Bryobacteraceae bacterium]|jgi:para-nitrobenzyl esterase
MKHLVVLIASVLPLAAAIDGTVRIDSGAIAGVPSSTPGIYVFRGIPYAAPPVGNLRWHAPRPAAAWTGVRKMDRFGERCVQPLRANPRETQGSEDCLYLNVWTPAKSAADKLPVMVWIHGGGFRDGTGAMLLHDGEQLARKGVVLVTINYRLGALGFLAYPELSRESDRNASGNYGLMDAIASLGWVQRNIAALGGDPAKVTIFGQSAGSMAVNCLQASPLAKGFFRAVIGESGASFRGMLNNGAMAEAEAKGVKFAESVGAKSLAELRAKPASQLITAPFAAGPNTDGYVLPAPPLSLFEEGKQNHVPALIGSNSDEGRLFARGPMTAQKFIDQARQRFGAAADEYLKLYPAGSDAQAAESRQRSATEESMGMNVRLWAKAQAKAGSKAYVYFFTRVTAGGAPSNYPADQPRLGAPHGEDLAYTFNNIGNIEALRNSETFHNAQPDAYDLKLGDIVSSYWVNFAKSLDPNGGSLPVWPKFDPAQADLVMELGDHVGMRPHPDNAGIVFLEAHPFQVSR